MADLEARQRAAWLFGFRDRRVEVFSPSSGTTTIDAPTREGLMPNTAPIGPPARYSISATILRTQLQYTIGEGLTASDVTPGNLGLHLQVDFVPLGAQTSGLSMGPITLYGSYSGGNFQFRGMGFSQGGELIKYFPQVTTPHYNPLRQ